MRHPLLHFALICLAVLFLSPLLWLFLAALKSPDERASDHWLPAQPRWGNFADAFTRIDFSGHLLNSVILACLYSVLTTASSVCAGYGFARLTARGEKPLFALLVMTMMTPGIVTLVPTYLLFARLGLVGTYWPWVLWGLGGNAYIIFLFRQFFAAVPRELEEAAFIDGCGHVRLFLRVVLPQSGPALTASAVLTFAWAWGDWTGPRLLLDERTTTLAVAVPMGYADPSGHGVDNLLAAGSLLYVLPLLLLFLFAQRYFTAGAYASWMR
ncbi:carbohydrate ABC transporter membrane protein 2 (CUT1 family) [Actinocorallia herbida]|uniref:Carbohydrate ABC transporter membrane protein 2 (CUT1 family) n=1 Tax=Actinocorallia herbida TaxID=58109 RepID=A0A3N1DAI5_9ACTN|nr:carbohydrate ABC transporter permease [Actinocorallia herbida]ROO90541.1 carbohydrate ABC transporter membrane protein 2 (CUT1 family) [Actinocorallia herbida]